MFSRPYTNSWNIEHGGREFLTRGFYFSVNWASNTLLDVLTFKPKMPTPITCSPSSSRATSAPANRPCSTSSPPTRTSTSYQNWWTSGNLSTVKTFFGSCTRIRPRTRRCSNLTFSSPWCRITSRSLFSAKYCFIKRAREHGNLSDAEYEAITDWINYLTCRSQLDLQVDLVFHVHTSQEVAWNRVKSRGRSEEDTVPLKYLQEIHQLHED